MDREERHVTNELMLANDQGLPVFKGEGFDEHVETWRTVDESMQNHLWFLGAIASSLEKKHGEDSAGRFASRVGCSTRRVRQFAYTYREWEKRKALSVLSFHHHTISARDPNPERVLKQAHDNSWSTRELEQVVKQHRIEAGEKKEDIEEEEEHKTVMICPQCEGNGVVPTPKRRKSRRRSG